MRRTALTATLGLGLALPLSLAEAAAQNNDRATLEAQVSERQISGTVSEAGSGVPLPQAQVQLKGTLTGTQVDDLGRFSIRAPAGDVVLLIKALGYRPMETTVRAGRVAAEIAMERVVIDLDEVVISGQATGVARRHVATTVTTVSAQDLTRVSQQTIEHAIQGKVPGAQISQRTGAPGGGNQVRIRGISTLLGGTTTPLYVIDGVIVADTYVSSGQSRVTNGLGSESPANRITDLDMNDIADVQVLKGAAAAAIYGSKASSGVVLITTKRGQVGRVRWNVSEGVGTSRLAYRNGQRRWSYDDAIAYFGSSAEPYFDPATRLAKVELDYEDLAYGEKPLHNDLSVSVSGGTPETRFFISGAYRDEGGIVANTGARKANVRANLDQILNDRLSLQLSSSFMSDGDDRGIFDNENGPSGIGSSVGFNIPRIPSFLDLRQRSDGTWPLNPFIQSNPLQNIALAKNHDEVLRGILSAQLRWNIFSSDRHELRFVSVGGADGMIQRYEVLSPPELQSEAVITNPGRAVARDHRSVMSNLNLNLVHAWRPTSRLTVTTQAGTQYERASQDVLNAESANLAGGLEVVNAGASTTFSLGDQRILVDDFGFFAQSEWLFNDRLLVTAGGRADRSSANGDAGRFYLFPKASASYRLTGSELEFMGASNVIDEIKFRVAYGETGNRPFYGDKFTPLAQATVGGQTAYRTATTLNDPNLRPERQRELEGGFDASFLSNALSVEATAYRRDISDLLLTGTPPPSTGYLSTFSNLGGLRVHGYEAAVAAFPVRRSRFTWTSRATFGMNRSRVTEMRGDSIIVFGSRLTEGQVLLREGHSATEITGIDSVPEPGTLVRVGNGAPKWTGGWSNEFRWRGLSLYALLDHQEGSLLWSGTWALYDNNRNSRDWDVSLPDGRKLGEVRSAAVSKVTRIRVQDATYTKLRELTLGWELPASIRDRMGGARTARLLLSGRNLHWWTKFRGGDPEAENFFGGFALPQVQRNRELAAYPASRVYWLTLNLEY